MKIAMFVRKVAQSYQRQGVAGTIRIATERVRRAWFLYRMRFWPTKEVLPDLLACIARLQQLPLDPLITVDYVQAVQIADAAVHDRFTVFAATVVGLTDQLWHTDHLLAQENATADAQFAGTYVADSKLGYSDAQQQRTKDLRVVWELSRLHHLPIVAYQYHVTADEQYAQTIKRHLDHWMQHNPYLYGVNWLCPMEVALRAINSIVALAYIAQSNSSVYSTTDWHIYMQLLYRHKEYLEYTWEWYDGRTSNHYLADLVGYAYVCWLYADHARSRKQSAWVVAELVREIAKQVHPEGSDYEGSTAYHRLVTEMVAHAVQIIPLLGFELPSWLSERFKRMQEFITWCSYRQGHMVTIGDNDSGSVLHQALRSVPAEAQPLPTGMRHFAAFGLSCMRTDRVHITLRHQVYHVRQPSGHLHNDAGSITLAIDGIPVFVDPGSYLYTAHPDWRNRFRSATMHSCMSIADHEPVPLTNELFYLAQPTATMAQQPVDAATMAMQHTLYARFGLVSCRYVQVLENKIVITDQWQGQTTVANSLSTQWYYVLHPDITVEQIDQHEIILLHNGRRVALIHTDYAVKIVPSWVSLQYSTKQATLALYAQQLLDMRTWCMHITFA